MIRFVVYSHVVIDSIELSDGEILADQLGGAGTYAAAGATLVSGVGDVGLVSGIGSDFPESARSWLEASGIDARGLCVVDERTPRTKVVYATDGTRVETPLLGSEHFRAADPSVSWQPSDYGGAYGTYLFLTAHDSLWNDIRPKTRSVVVLWEIDAESCEPAQWESVVARASQVDVLSINREELAGLAGSVDVGTAVERLRQAGFGHVLVRLGGEGALVVTADRALRARPMAGPAVDPTGAGNAFSGAYLAMWAQTGDPERSLSAAMAVAAQTISQLGVPAIDAAARAHTSRLASAQEVEAVSGRHYGIGAAGELLQFGRSVSPLNDGSLARFDHVDNIPLRGFLIDGRPALTRVDPEAVADYVLITVRDPLCDYDTDPAEVLARELDSAELVGKSGMFTTYTGSYHGVPVSVVSGGSGGPEAELAMHEFLEYTDATTFIRVGGSGGMHPSVRPGDLVVASGIVRDEGLTASYVAPSYPASCAPEVVFALASAAQQNGARYHIGTIRSADSDYVGGGRPSVAGYFQPWHEQLAQTWIKAGVLSGDRESAAIVTLARLFGRRGGSICSVADNLSTGEPFRNGAGHSAAIQIALEGIVLLNQMDSERDAAELPMWLPLLDGRHRS